MYKQPSFPWKLIFLLHLSPSCQTAHDFVTRRQCVNQAGSGRKAERGSRESFMTSDGESGSCSVFVLLASSSTPAIELITLYARLDNAEHKMAPPSTPPHLPPFSPFRPLGARHRIKRDLCIAPGELESNGSSVSIPLCDPHNEEMQFCAEPPMCKRCKTTQSQVKGRCMQMIHACARCFGGKCSGDWWCHVGIFKNHGGSSASVLSPFRGRRLLLLIKAHRWMSGPRAAAQLSGHRLGFSSFKRFTKEI